MTKQMYALRDLKGNYFLEPQFQHTHGEAERSLKSALNAPNSMIGAYPEDYDLYHLGSYDNSNASFKLLELPTLICNAASLKE